jgi:hypothetical protein
MSDSLLGATRRLGQPGLPRARRPQAASAPGPPAAPGPYHWLPGPGPGPSEAPVLAARVAESRRGHGGVSGSETGRDPGPY